MEPDKYIKKEEWIKMHKEMEQNYTEGWEMRERNRREWEKYIKKDGWIEMYKEMEQNY